MESQVMTINVNGKILRAVPDEISIEYAIQRGLTETGLSRRKGELAALEQIPMNYLETANLRTELTEDQISKIEQVRNRFAADVAALDVPDVARVNKLKLKYCDEITPILLPAQLNALASYADNRIRILSRLTEEESTTGIDLSPIQKQKILDACKTLKDPLEQILKRHEQELLEYREKVKSVCNDVLTEEQLDQMRKRWNDPDRCINAMNLQNILDDVALEVERNAGTK
jgi:hypothetical protein